MSTPKDPRIGTELAGFRIESVIGRGGMGVVYKAEQLRYGRMVALKVLAPELTADQTFRERFEQEWRTATRLEHPNIIPIYEAGEAEGVLYIAMRHVEGIDMGALLASEGRLAPERALAILGQVAAALDTAHAQGLVHRDVKPANILIAAGAAAEGDHAYLADFGVAKQARTRSGLTQTGVFVGTVDYAAPEQIAGKSVDGRADVYALGCVLYQCLAGARPFEKDSDVAMMSAHLFEPPPSLHGARPEIPAEIDAVIAKAMAKAPEDRYPTCRELLAAARAAARRPAARTVVEAGKTAVEALPGGAPPTRAETAAAGPSGPWWRSRLALGGAALLVAVLGIGLGVGLGMSGGGSEQAGPPAQEPPPAEPPGEEPPPAVEPSEVEPPAVDPSEVEPPAVEPTSPVTGALVFASQRDGDFDVYAMALDGSGRVRLTNHAATDGGPRWSPDGAKIAFYSDRDGDYDLYLMNADGTGVERLTDDTVREGRPTFSPDGAQLAFEAGEGEDAEIWMVNVDGSGLAQLTDNGVQDTEPAWSPDGATIAFSRWDGNDYEIWALDVAGGGEIQLTDNTGNDGAPAWSPDGSTIVFGSNRENVNYDIWVMNADGSEPRRLATASKEDGLPAFARDGSQVVFDSDRDGDFEIFVMNADGSSQTQLTDDFTSDFEPHYSELAIPPSGEPLLFLEDASAFPTRREALLLSHVPLKTRQTCARETRQDIAGRAIAGVVCTRGPVTAFYDLFRTKAAMNGYYNRAVSSAGAARGVGSCRTSDVSEGYWTLGEERVGRLVCYTSSSGRRIAIWTYDRLKIVSWAQRNDGDRAALYRFWIGPNSGPLE